MNELLLKIKTHIIAASRAGYTSCAYEVDSSIDQYVIKQVQRELIAYGCKVTRDKRILKIDWSQP